MVPSRALARLLLLASLLVVVPASPRASEEPTADRTLSPYFFVEGGDSGTDRLPLLGTNVRVEIAGVIAHVSVRQSYKNDGTRPIHARYVFPASTRAAVHGLTMTVDHEVVRARIRERGQARQEFKAAQAAGKNAALLEQQRPNVFTMELANVMPGQRIDVDLEYSELLVPTAGTYEFVYPTVVGPRYSSTPAAEAGDSDRWVASPYLHEGQAPTYDVALSGSIAAGLRIDGLESPSHALNAQWSDSTHATFAIDDSDRRGGNRDFILRYRLRGGQIQAGLLLYDGSSPGLSPGGEERSEVQGNAEQREEHGNAEQREEHGNDEQREELGKENFFLLMVQPPRRIDPSEIPPREYVFVVDVSGSMAGFPLGTAKALLRDLVGQLRRNDTFDVLTFAGTSELWRQRPVPATRANVTAAIAFLDGLAAGGGTELLAALDRALALPESEEPRSRSIVIVTDGYISAEAPVFDRIRQNLGRTNVFAFGIGTGVNRYLIEGVARAGLGEPFVVTDARQATATAARFREYIESPLLTRTRVTFDGFDAYDVEPQAIPDVLADRPVLIQGKWRGEPQGRIVLTGATGAGRFTKSIEVSAAEPDESNHALRELWARTRVADLSDWNAESDEHRQQVVALGLEYNLLTRYTSFIAVHDVIRNPSGVADNVAQPLPLPAGVSDAAVGGSGSLAMGDEPGLAWLLAAAALLAGCGWLWRKAAWGAAER